MNKRKRQRRVAAGRARWMASRMEGVQKNRGIKKTKKRKGARTMRPLKKSVRARTSKKSLR